MNHLKVIPPELLPERYRKGKYFISLDGKVYGVRGHRLKQDLSPTGLNPPILFSRNCWELAAKVWEIPNPNNCKRVVKIDGRIHWIPEDNYFKMLAAWRGIKNHKVPLTEKQIDYIIRKYKKISVKNIAEDLKVSRNTIHRYIRKLNL